MRVAHFDCFSGISGDMTLGALISAGVDAKAIQVGIESLNLPVKLEIEAVQRAGFAATYVHVAAQEQHAHRYLRDIEEIIDRSRISQKQKQLAHRIFRRLGEAEAAAHGIPLEEVHFHEVGALDSVADIVGAAIGLDLLEVDKFTSRSVVTGHGTIKAEHGTLPVPTPATAVLLRGIPLAPSEIKTELTTPTGAAILTTVVQEWIEQPVMRVDRIGHGAGKRDFASQPNILRLFLGESEASPTTDQVWVLETNIDDLPAEIIGYCYELLLAAGALDVFTQPIFMKKNRPGVLLTVLCQEGTIAKIEQILFRETTTLGIRRYAAQRHKLERKAHTVQTRFGPIKGKLSWNDSEAATFDPEFDDCARIAREHHLSLRHVCEEARRAYNEVLASQ